MFITGFAAVTLKAGKTMPQARVLSKPFHLRDLVLEVDRMFGIENAASGVNPEFRAIGACAGATSPLERATPRGRVAQW